MTDLRSEITLQTTRSGGSGGQNVNKVETAAMATFYVMSSGLLTSSQNEQVLRKLANRINAAGFLLVRAQTHRTQIQNKEEAIRRINELVQGALHRKKARIATQPTRAAKERRVETKKKAAGIKQNRRKLRPGDV